MPRDIQQDENGDILLVNGDIKWGEATGQHMHDLLRSRMGDNRTAPTVGVASDDYMDDETPDDWFRAIRTQFARDGMKVKSIRIAGGKLEIDAHYLGETPDYANAKDIVFADADFAGSTVQSLIGLAIQEYGNVDAIMEIVANNDFSGKMDQPGSFAADEIDLGYCFNTTVVVAVDITSQYYDAATLEAMKERNAKGELVKRYIIDGVPFVGIFTKQFAIQFL